MKDRDDRLICPAVVPEGRFKLWPVAACLLGIAAPAVLALASLLALIVGVFG